MLREASMRLGALAMPKINILPPTLLIGGGQVFVYSALLFYLNMCLVTFLLGRAVNSTPACIRVIKQLGESNPH